MLLHEKNGNKKIHWGSCCYHELTEDDQTLGQVVAAHKGRAVAAASSGALTLPAATAHGKKAPAVDIKRECTVLIATSHLPFSFVESAREAAAAAAAEAAAAAPEGAAAPGGVAAGGQKRRVRDAVDVDDDAECIDGLLGTGALTVADNGMLVSVDDAADHEGAEGAEDAGGGVGALPVAAQLGCDPAVVRLTLTKTPHDPMDTGAGAGADAGAGAVGGS